MSYKVVKTAKPKVVVYKNSCGDHELIIEIGKYRREIPISCSDVKKLGVVK